MENGKPTQKQTALIEEFIEQTGAEYHRFYRELADFAVSLGYKPLRNKTAELTVDFIGRNSGVSIMKFQLTEGRHDGYAYGERGLPGLRLKFFAAGEYSEIFRHGVKTVIEDFGGKYTGCYGCGRCQGEPQGYTYVYPDGRSVFRCGRELIPVYDFGESNLDEIKALLKTQAEYYEAQSAES